MTQKEYEQKKRECWEEFKREVQCLPVSRHDVFCAAFDRAYALGREQETITQEERNDGIVYLWGLYSDEAKTVEDLDHISE